MNPRSRSGASGMLRMSSFHSDTVTTNGSRMGLHLEMQQSVSMCVRLCVLMQVCISLSSPVSSDGGPFNVGGLQHAIVGIKNSPVVKYSVPLYLFELRDKCCCQMSHLLRLPDLQHRHTSDDRVGIFLGS